MILFAGDSFSFNDEVDCWPNILSKELDMPFLNFSYGGSSLWYSYDKLTDPKISEKILKNEISYLILTCTSKDRVPFCASPEKSCLKPIEIKKENNILDDDFVNFVYYNKFYSIKFHNFVYKEILSRLISMYGKNTKIVLLSCFGDSIKFFKEIYSYQEDFLYCETPLMSLAKMDTENIKYKNHLTLKDNEKLASILFDKIQQIKSGSFTLTK